MATAVGDVKYKGNSKRAICLMTAQVANNGTGGGAPPASVTAGVPNYPDETQTIKAGPGGACYTGLCARESVLMIASTAGSGVMVGTFTIWGFLEASQQWYPIKVNGGSALAETSADKILYQERFLNLGCYDRLFLELSAVGGTSTAFEAWLATGNEGQY